MDYLNIPKIIELITENPILIRVLWVAFTGFGIGQLIKVISDRLSLYKNQRTRKRISLNAEIIALLSNILVSIGISYSYFSYCEKELDKMILESIAYGLAAITVQLIFTSKAIPMTIGSIAAGFSWAYKTFKKK